MRPIRSPRTGQILLLLHERPRTAKEIAEELGVWPSEAHAYLHALRKRGVAEHNDGVWSLTEYGKQYYKTLEDHIMLILRFMKIRINNNKQESIRINVIRNLETKIKEWAGKVYNDCRDVLELFLKLRERGTYVELPHNKALEYLWEISQELGISSIDTRKLRECIEDLRARGVLFVYQRGSVVKIRLNRHLEEPVLTQGHHRSSRGNGQLSSRRR